MRAPGDVTFAQAVAGRPLYLAYSGFVGDIALAGGFVAFTAHAIVSYRHKNCHVRGCPRIGHLQVAGTPYVVCRKHSPTAAPTHSEVIEAHRAVTGERRRP